MREYSLQWSEYKRINVNSVSEGYLGKFSHILLEDLKTLISLNLDQQDAGLNNCSSELKDIYN